MKTRCYVGNIAAAQNVKKKEILRRRIEEQQNQKKDDKNSLINIAMFDKTSMLLTGFFKG